MALYSKARGTITLGTGKAGKCIGRKAIRKAYQKEFSEIGEIKAIEHKNLSLFVFGEIAALAADINIAAVRRHRTMTKTGRVTAVLKKPLKTGFSYRRIFLRRPSNSTQDDKLLASA
jgi:hypothetical protein